MPVSDSAESIRRLVDSGNVSLDRPAVISVSGCLRPAVDFAAGVIGFEGLRFGGAVFTCFDRNAVERLQAASTATRLLR